MYSNPRNLFNQILVTHSELKVRARIPIWIKTKNSYLNVDKRKNLVTHFQI